MQHDPRPTKMAPDDDPHLWLEDIEGGAALEWVAKQSTAAMDLFGDRHFERDRDELAAILDRSDKIPMITRRGTHVYNFWQDARNPRGLWRRCSMADYLKAEPEWELLLDLDNLAKAEGEDWTWGGAFIEPEKRERAILRLSRGGSDAVVHREFDLRTTGFVSDGFFLPEAKGGIAWLDQDTLLLSSAIGEGMATRAGYARTVRLWRRGEDPLTAPVIFETDAGAMSAGGSCDRTVEGEQIWFVERPGFFEAIGWMGDRCGPKTRIDLPLDSWWSAYRDWLVVKPRKPWTVSGTTYAADMLLGISLSAFLRGERAFATLFEPGERRSLQSFFWNDGRLVISVLDNLVPRFEVIVPGQTSWTRYPIETVPSTGTAHVWSLDAEPQETSGEVLVSVQDPITPPQLLMLDLRQEPSFNAPALLKSSPRTFDASGLTVTPS